MKYIVEIKGDKTFDQCFKDIDEIDTFEIPPICIKKISEENEKDLTDASLDAAQNNNKSINNTMTSDQEFWYATGWRDGYLKCKEKYENL